MEPNTPTGKRDAPRVNYCFTYNNYTPEGEIALKDWLIANTKYSVFGHEVAPTTGTPHLQGFMSLNKKRRTETLHNILSRLGVKVSLKYADGSPLQNRVYCSKVDKEHFFEHGNIESASKGHRSDLAEACKILKRKRLDTFALENPVQYVRYYRGFKELKSVYNSSTVPNYRNLTTTVLFGDAGAGKSRRAHDEAKALGVELYQLPDPNGQSLWFDGYDNEEGLLIDDFYGWIKPALLFKVLDVYKFQVPIKGGFVYPNWKYVWITSNTEPINWYKELSGQKLQALLRRLHNIYYMHFVEDTVMDTVQKELKKIEFELAPEPTPVLQNSLDTNTRPPDSPDLLDPDEEDTIEYSK